MVTYRKKKLSSLLIKPAGPDCNMAFTYCFYLKKIRFFPGIDKKGSIMEHPEYLEKAYQLGRELGLLLIESQRPSA